MAKSAVFAAILLSLSVSAQVAEYGQCPTACASPYVCTVINPYYSQCLPGSTSTTSHASTTTSTTSHVSTATSTSSTITSLTTTTKTTTTSTPISSATSSAPPSTISGTTATGQEIRADQDPVYHFYLQNSAGTAVLGPEAGDGIFNINGSILDTTTGLYLNIAPSTGPSYRGLTFDKTPTFTGWSLEGDTIITATTSTYGRQLNFLGGKTSYVMAHKCGESRPNDGGLRLRATSCTKHRPLAILRGEASFSQKVVHSLNYGVLALRDLVIRDTAWNGTVACDVEKTVNWTTTWSACAGHAPTHRHPRTTLNRAIDHCGYGLRQGPLCEPSELEVGLPHLNGLRVSEMADKAYPKLLTTIKFRGCKQVVLLMGTSPKYRKRDNILDFDHSCAGFIESVKVAIGVGRRVSLKV
ncbi:hypothetical protein FRB96_003437 [Tulasnella sp. 330]|nr:hypothetical protein FRB96_003437 [Tulasnella sp. 330]